MRYGSVCSGIEAATVAWHPLGWEPAFFSEIEPAPRAVLAHHYPDVPLHGDFTTIGADEYGPIDLLVGGTPCQSFSIAGLRGGLADDRGNLALEFCRLAWRKRPRWIVWENVPGVLSSNGGRDFGSILGGLAQVGYGFAYRVLDAQYFGVPQRRRRVFVVGHLGDWRPAAAVLFERHSLSGDSPPRREARQDATHPTAPCLTSSGRWVERTGDTRGQDPVVAVPETSHRDVAACLTAGTGQRFDTDTDTFVSYAPLAFNHNAQADQLPTEGGRDTSVSDSLTCSQQAAVAFDLRGREGGSQFEGPHDTANIRAASGGSSKSYVASSRVRRLTPVECERLQGFPDDYTLVPIPKTNRHGNVTRRPLIKDGPRYKMLGNSMAVPAMRWIGERIALVDALGCELL